MQYKIKKDDTLSSISRNLGISVKDLASANKIKDVNKIQAGASLTIPQPKKKKSSSIEKVIPQAKNIESVQKAAKKTKKEKSDSSIKKYNIQQGDNLYDIARENLLNVDQLMKANPNITNPNKIKIGQKINVPQFGVQEEIEFNKRLNLTAETPKDRFLPSNVRQLLYDINPFKFGKDKDFTEGDLDKEEYAMLQKLVAEKVKLGETSLGYKDYTNSNFDDVGGGKAFGLSQAIDKFNDPAYALKTLLGNANIETNKAGETVVTDRYNFNEAEPKNLSDYANKLRLMASNPLYQVPRQLGSMFGSNENEGSRVRLNLGNLNQTSAQGGQTRYNFNQGGKMDIKQQTQNVANQGRYGDSMLLHVNPAEVKGLAQAMPITVNPETGQPEAFLPFLAPILGGMLGSSLLTGAAMGSTLFGAAGISSALATGIGAGLTSYAQSGGSGKRALFSALTGYGGAKAAELAGGAAASSADIATNTGNLTTELSANLAQDPNMLAQLPFTGPLPQGAPLPELGNLGNMELQKQLAGFQPALQQSGANAADAFYAGPSGGFRPDLKDSLGKAFSGDGGYPEGFGNLLQGATSQAAYLPMAVGVGGTGLMESQDLYEQQERERIADDEESKRQMYLNNPEPMLYSASGGTTNFEGGGLLEKTLSGDYGVLGILKNNPELAFGAAGIAAKNNFRGSFLGELYNYFKERKNAGDEQGANEIALQIQQEESSQMAYGGMTQFKKGGDTDNYDSESGKQVYAPVKQQYEVNPNFMAGFAPETMYFRPDTINAPATNTRGGSRPTLGADTYTGTKGGYDYEGTVDADGNYVAGTAQGVQFAPQTFIDPYAAFTGSAPQGLVQSAYNPYPVQPMSMSPTDDTEDTSDYGGVGEGDYDGDQGYVSDLNLMGGNMGGFDPTSFMGASGVTNQYIQNQQIQEYLDSLNNPTTDIGDAFTADGPMGKAQGGVTNYANQGQTEIMPMDVMPEASAQPMQDPLIQEVTMFILGESDNEQAVNQFVDKYGVEAFSQLREQILQSLVPNAQTEGLIAGVGNGGMDDDIMGTIGNKEKIAVSQDEFIIPADVVSMLGDGSSDAGSKELYDMMDRVRQKKTGTTKQAPKLANAGGYLPA
jgi:LysM repeat protein